MALRKTKNVKPTGALAFFLAAVTLHGCFAERQSSLTVTLKHDAVVTVGSESPKEYKAGASFHPHSSPILVEARGHVSAYVYASRDAAGEMTVALKPLADLIGPDQQRLVTHEMTEVAQGIVQAQKLLSVGKAEDALVITERLQARLPDFIFLDLLRASCLVASNQQERAKDTLRAVLKKTPDEPEALKMLQKLEGRADPSGLAH